jgi:cytoskeleton protein RodZ
MSEQTSTIPDTDHQSMDNAGVGPLLRASRQRVGEELRDVAIMLRIRFPYLEAIEEGRYADLPGKTYAVGFVRAYAEHLGLDKEEVVRRYKAEIEIGDGKNELHFPTPMMETGIPGGAIVFIGFIVAVLAYGGWYLSTTEEGYFSDLISPLPERLSNLVSENDKPVVSEAPKPQPAPEMVAPEQVPEPEIKVETPPEAAPVVKAVSQEVIPAAAPEPVVTPPVAPNSEVAAAVQVAPEVTPEVAPEVTPQETQQAADSAAETPATPAPEQPEQPEQPVQSTPSAPETPSAAPSEASTETQPADTPAVATAVTVETLPDVTPAAAPDNARQSETPPVTLETVQQSETEPETQTEALIQPKPSRISVRAQSNSWIEVRDDFSNTILVSRLLSEGEIYQVPDQPGLSLHTGNAGALEISVDGATVPAIGADGDVRRGVQLDPDLLLAGTAAR